jgi:AhpD family alkylhydroperoxidase
MTRIAGPPNRTGAITRLTLRLARRKTARMTGRETDKMIAPLQAFAHAPGLLAGYGALELACSKARRVELHLKELAVLKAATMVNCEYCIDIGSAIARRSGCSDEQLLALARYRDSTVFSSEEKLVLDLAAAMTRAPVVVPDELFEALGEHFDDGQLVELVNVIALENFRARFNAALDIGAAGFSDGMVCAAPAGESEGAIVASGGPVAVGDEVASTEHAAEVAA